MVLVLDVLNASVSICVRDKSLAFISFPSNELRVTNTVSDFVEETVPTTTTYLMNGP